MFEEIRGLVKDFMVLQQEFRSLQVIDQKPYLRRLEVIDKPLEETADEQRVRLDHVGVREEAKRLEELFKASEEQCRRDEGQLEKLKAQLGGLITKRQQDSQIQAEQCRLVDARLQSTLLACVQARNRLQELKVNKMERRRSSLALAAKHSNLHS
jgi:hypothetical protein